MKEKATIPQKRAAVEKTNLKRYDACQTVLLGRLIPDNFMLHFEKNKRDSKES